MKIKIVILSLAGTIMLSGCSSLQQTSSNLIHDVKSGSSSLYRDVKSGLSEVTSGLKDFAALPEQEDEYSSSDMLDVKENNVNQLVTHMSDSDIQIYNIDNNTSAAGSRDSIAWEKQGSDRPVREITDVRKSTSSVEVFKFDPVQSSGHRNKSGGVEYAHDESVMVFPLDSGKDPYGIQRLGKQERTDVKIERVQKRTPDLMPAKTEGSIYVSPFVNGAASTIEPPMHKKLKKPAASTPTPTKSSFVVGQGVPTTIYFGHGSATLDAKDRSIVSELARSYKMKPNVVGDAGIKVQGHASTRSESGDPVTRRITNLKMSMKRALSVSNALIKAGVPSTKITTMAYGDTRPGIAKRNANKETASRRVEVYGAK